MALKLIFMGAPGAGKGTHSGNLSRRLGIPVISTGQILRDAIAAGDALGDRVKQYTDNGLLVPDEVMIDVVKQRIAQPDCYDGFILDGFPRTIVQAEALKGIVDIDAVLNLDVSDDEIERRMSGRRVCVQCGATFHVEHNPPQAEAVCDACGGELKRRVDDEPETVRIRLKAYHDKTEPLIGYYSREGKLRSVAAAGTVEETAARCVEALAL